MNNVIDAENINKHFVDGDNKIEVLKNIHLQVATGEMLGIVGASGSGKSTLLHILGGLDKPTSGRLTINNVNVAHLNAKQLGQLRNQTLGFVYQFHHLLPEFSALENVAMPLLIAGESTTVAADKAAAILSKVGLAQRLTHRPAKLSGGERQRAAIARALITQPACVLADEPTGNLDSKTAQAVFELLLELNQTLQASFVIVTHDVQLSQRLQRRITLVDGEVIAEP